MCIRDSLSTVKLFPQMEILISDKMQMNVLKKRESIVFDFVQARRVQQKAFTAVEGAGRI